MVESVMQDPLIDVEVAFAKPNEQLVIAIKLTVGSSVCVAINQSGLLERYPEIDLAVMKCGIFGKVCTLEKIVEEGDRVEIYRPLLQNPMDARRQRATH